TFRFYDPDVGRFTTPDPIGLHGGLNLYTYSANPFSWIDPLGWALTPLNKEGFIVYGLYEPGADKPYYVGHTEQLSEVREDQHRRSGRLGNARLKILEGEDGKMTYSQSKGYEQAYREKYKTKGKFPNNVIEPIDKSRTDKRGKSHYKNYRAAAKALGIKPSKIKTCK
ncbi:RHS repeat-associated core domain-containing protein, partial [Pseudomonas marginalis]